MVNAPTQRKHDLVVFGVTGFTGLRTALYVAQNAPSDLIWAVAGRSRGKVEEARRKVLNECEGKWIKDVDVVVADSADQASIDEMVGNTRVIISTVGPYAKFGTPVIDACVRFGTDYIDITGETPWIRKMIDQYHERAKAKGVLIIPSCGFDSVPSDLLAFLASSHLRNTHPLHPSVSSVKATVLSVSGGVSGGTIASIVGLVEESVKEPSKLIGMATDGYYLNPSEDKVGPDAGWKFKLPTYFDFDFKKWQVPFVMEIANSKVVHRTSSLLNHSAGSFSYTETLSLPYLFFALGYLYFSALIFAILGVALIIPPLNSFLKKYVLPQPGTAVLTGGSKPGFVMRAIATSSTTGPKVKSIATFVGTSDPGYSETPKYAAESALAIVYQRRELPAFGVYGCGAGVVTPASALGMVLVERINKAGSVVKVELVGM